GIPWQGNYSSWLDQKQERLRREERAATARRKALERELEWIRMAPRARQTKNKARIREYERLASQVFEDRPEQLEIQIPSGPPLGDLVIEAERLTKGF